MSERRRRRRSLAHPYFRRRYRLLPLSLPSFLTGSSHDCVSQLCCRGQQSTRHPWNRRQGQRGTGRLGGCDGSPVGQDRVRIFVEASKDDCGVHGENESGEVLGC